MRGFSSLTDSRSSMTESPSGSCGDGSASSSRTPTGRSSPPRSTRTWPSARRTSGSPSLRCGLPWRRLSGASAFQDSSAALPTSSRAGRRRGSRSPGFSRWTRISSFSTNRRTTWTLQGPRTSWSSWGGCKENGKTIFISTHDVELAYPWADRVILLREGEILQEDSPEGGLRRCQSRQEGAALGPCPSRPPPRAGAARAVTPLKEAEDCP